MTGGSTPVPTDPGLETTVVCPHCEEVVALSLPDHDVEPTVRPSVAAFGDHDVVHCSAGHRFWVYYC